MDTINSISLNTPPKDYRVLFLDMNSFFASVEQQVQPLWRGRPIGVTPYSGDSGCIIAASYEAKQYGVRICRVGEAKKLCPNIKIVEARPALYMIYHKEIKKVIESFSPYYQPLSIDEFIIRLTPKEQNFKTTQQMALDLKEAIRNRVGDYLKCSIGVGPNSFLAKVAGERQKPDGLTFVRLEELKNFYTNLELMDIPGINYRMAAYLNQRRIYSPADFFNLGLSDMVRLLKHPGRLWYFRLRGYEVDEHVIRNKTIGHSHVLAPELRTKEKALSVVEKLIEKAAYRLRKEGYLAQGVYVSIHFMDHSGFHLGHKVEPFDDTASFREQVFFLLRRCPWELSGQFGPRQRRPIHVAVAAFNLVKKQGRQISIFQEIERAKEISSTLDKINDEFGADTVFPASMFLARGSAPDRIPFGQPRYDIKHGA